MKGREGVGEEGEERALERDEVVNGGGRGR